AAGRFVYRGLDGVHGLDWPGLGGPDRAGHRGLGPTASRTGTRRRRRTGNQPAAACGRSPVVLAEPERTHALRVLPSARLAHHVEPYRIDDQAGQSAGEGQRKVLVGVGGRSHSATACRHTERNRPAHRLLATPASCSNRATPPPPRSVMQRLSYTRFSPCSLSPAWWASGKVCRTIPERSSLPRKQSVAWSRASVRPYSR